MSKQLENTKERNLFIKLPVRVLLVDFYPLLDATICQDLCEALHDVIVLACNLSGPQRLPFFGLHALGNFPESLFPLQTTKNSLPSLLSALSELSNFHSDQLLNKPAKCCIEQGIRDVIIHYKRQAHSFLQTAGYWCQLEVTIVTTQNGATVSKVVEKTAAEMDTASLKKVQIICVGNPETEKVLEPASQKSNRSDGSSNSSMFDGIIDVTYLNPDLLTFHDHFKSWLTDHGTDSEHFRLILPSTNTEKELVLKCDLHDVLLNPCHLPFSPQYHLQADITSGRHGPVPNIKGQAMSVPIHSLQAVHLAPVNTLCESVMYGMPCITIPSTCWKIDWDELEANHELFYALCQSLKEKEMALISRLVVPNNKPLAKSHYIKSQSSESHIKPHGYFAFLPSDTCSLMVRPLAVSELMLPGCHLQTMIESAPQEHLDTVQSSLNQLEVVPKYNPYLIQSGLYAGLSSLVSKTSTNRLHKRKQPPNSQQIVYSSTAVRPYQAGGHYCVQPKKKQQSQHVKRLCQPQTDTLSTVAHHFPTEL